MSKKKTDAPNAPTSGDAERHDTVAFVQDPYGIPVEASEGADVDEDEAEDVDVESDEDAGDDESAELDAASNDEDYQRLAQAIADQVQADAAELVAAAPESDQEAQARLAQEIAEDQALEAALQAEAESLDQGDAELRAALPKLPEAADDGSLDLRELESCLEALLFMSDKPLSVNKLREWLGPDFPLNLFQEAVTSLRDRYQGAQHGIELVEVAGGLQFRTKPGRAALAKKLARVQTQRLSGGAMESLAIVAYRQPVLKDEIDKIRGVDSSHFIRTLLDKKLIQITGRSELPGRPMLYATTNEFLELFGLKSLDALPSLRELEQMVPASSSKNPEDEDPRVREMRKLVGQMNLDTSVTLAYDPKEDENILQQIRARVSSIPTSSPYLEAQKETERAAKQAALEAEAPLLAATAGNTPAPDAGPTSPEG